MLQYDVKRAAAFSSLGCLWNGPFLHAYFGALERGFPQQAGFRALLWKTAINQLAVNPLIYLPVFYAWTGHILGRTMEETIAKARREYWSSLYATWVIFTPVNLINFAFIPLRYQVVVNTVTSFVYNVTLSTIAAASTNTTALGIGHGNKHESSQGGAQLAARLRRH